MLDKLGLPRDVRHARHARAAMELDKFDMHDMKMDLNGFDMKMDMQDGRVRLRSCANSNAQERARSSTDIADDADASGDASSFATSPRAPWLQGDRGRFALQGRVRAAESRRVAARRRPRSQTCRSGSRTRATLPMRCTGRRSRSIESVETEDLSTALRSLETMRSKYPQAKTQSDAAALMPRIRGTLAARGDRAPSSSCRATVSEQGQQCDREDQAVRSEAIKSLAQTDPASLARIAKRVLAKKDACSAPLRRTVVYLLGNSGDNGSARRSCATSRSTIRSPRCAAPRCSTSRVRPATSR